MGAGPNAARLYEWATGRNLAEKKTLSDAEVAAIALYYISSDASVIHGKLGRTQLTEHLSKLTAIVNISELARALEATEGDEKTPYDATLLIKGGLRVVAEGRKSLRQMFYRGKGGEQSIFLGAPSQENSPSGIGGAEFLRHPSKYTESLDRQMGMFPDPKGQFKAFLNSLRSQAKIDLPELTEGKRKELETLAKQEEVNQARVLPGEIQSIKLPTRSEDVQQFTVGKAGPILKFQGKINAMLQQYPDNAEAVKVLKEARKALKEKSDAAAGMLDVGGSRRRKPVDRRGT